MKEGRKKDDALELRDILTYFYLVNGGNTGLYLEEHGSSNSIPLSQFLHYCLNVLSLFKEDMFGAFE